MEEIFEIISPETGAPIEVRIEADPDNGFVDAFIDDEEIGHFSYEISEGLDGYNRSYLIYELVLANIESRYQNIGIGSEMIRFGEEVFGSGKIIYPKMSNSRHENHLSHEGAALLQSCARKGIIDWEPWG